MPSTYDTLTYLLDKSYITDTITRMMICFDTEDYPTLINEVYTPSIHLDYETVLGSKAETVSSSEWTKRLAEIHEPFDSMQHIVQYIKMNHRNR